MPQMELVTSMSFAKEHALLHRVVGTKIYCETITPARKDGSFGKQRQAWYHAEDPRLHKTYEEAAKFVPVENLRKVEEK